MYKTAMILAAGSGTRLGELGKTTPKALLRFAGKYLIDYQLEKLAAAGVEKVVINVHHLADDIQQALSAHRYDLQLAFSIEEQVLGTGGGIWNALPLLGREAFIISSVDVWSDYDLTQLPQPLNGLAHLVMGQNPPEHLNGDYGLQEGKVSLTTIPQYTYKSIGVFHPELFKDCAGGTFGIAKVLNPAIEQGQVSGEYYAGDVFNINNLGNITELEKRLV